MKPTYNLPSHFGPETPRKRVGGVKKSPPLSGTPLWAPKVIFPATSIIVNMTTTWKPNDLIEAKMGEQKRVANRIKEIEKQISLQESLALENDLLHDKTYQYYITEVKNIPLRREKKINEIHAKRAVIEAAYKAKHAALEAEMNGKIDALQRAIDAIHTEAESDTRLQFCKDEAEKVRISITTPKSAAYKKLRAEHTQLKEQYDALETEVKAACQGAVEESKKKEERYAIQAKEEELRKAAAEAKRLAEGQKAYEERMAAENEAQLQRTRAQMAAAAPEPVAEPEPDTNHIVESAARPISYITQTQPKASPLTPFSLPRPLAHQFTPAVLTTTKRKILPKMIPNRAPVALTTPVPPTAPVAPKPIARGPVTLETIDWARNDYSCDDLDSIDHTAIPEEMEPRWNEIWAFACLLESVKRGELPRSYYEESLRRGKIGE